jgi:hypothetical protein
MFAVVLGMVPDGEAATQKYREIFARRGKGKAGPLKLPPGGFVLPANAVLLREKYDKNKDGKLSQEELEAIPQPLRDRVEAQIRKRLAADAARRQRPEGSGQVDGPGEGPPLEGDENRTSGKSGRGDGGKRP